MSRAFFGKKQRIAAFGATRDEETGETVVTVTFGAPDVESVALIAAGRMQDILLDHAEGESVGVSRSNNAEHGETGLKTMRVVVKPEAVAAIVQDMKEQYLIGPKDFTAIKDAGIIDEQQYDAMLKSHGQVYLEQNKDIGGYRGAYI